MRISQLNMTPELEWLYEGLKVAKTPEDIEAWFKKMGLEVDYEVSARGTVSSESFSMTGFTDVKALGVAFEEVAGDLKLSHNGFITLKGCPKQVGGNYEIVGGKFLKSLAYGPEIVHGDCEIFATEIKSLEGAPKTVGGKFLLSSNSKLTSFKGAPVHVNGDVIIEKNGLMDSLEGLPVEIGGTLDLSGWYGGSLKGIGRVHKCSTIKIAGVTKNILGLMMIEGLKSVTVGYSKDGRTDGYDEKLLKKALSIISPHYGKGREDKKLVFKVQEELIDADLDEYAEL